MWLVHTSFPLFIFRYTFHMKKGLITSLSIGSVHLAAGDLETLVHFYTNSVGMDVLACTSDTVSLGFEKDILLTLHDKKHLPPKLLHHTGLYHFAVVFKERNDLSKVIHNILSSTPEIFAGSADHLVSEAFYFTDPEGNGIELYFDRDRSEWQWEEGEVKMASLYIDPIEYLKTHLKTDIENPVARMGHVHLKVGDIDKAHAFYVSVLGFDVTARLPGALFISVEGYHHHIGLNTWNSEGAKPREESIGLQKIELIFTSKDEVAHLQERLSKNNILFTINEGRITFNDPWNNTFEVTSSYSS